MSQPIQLRHLLTGAAVALLATGCVKDNTTSPSGVNAKDAAFVGYSNATTKQTTCGNCHVLKQQTWIQTGHANAWADLQASGHASASCDQCHTVNGMSNTAPDTAGYFSVPASAKIYYQDVQCEACHGPGQLHVTTPDETQPIPYFVSRDSALGVGCGQCHSGPPHNPFMEDWSRGAHGSIVADAAGNSSCKPCHEGKTAALRFGSSDVFQEFSDTKLYPIGCVTCHNPHGSSNTHEVRASVTVRDTTNFCIQCHHKRGVPDPTTWRGAHSPQGPVFLGIAGWRPAGFTWDSSNIATHSDPGTNPGMCTTCHMATLDLNNAAGKLAWHYTGHSFWAAPCVDTLGIDSTNSCDDSQRNFTACTTSGCHATQGTARSLLESLNADLHYFADAIWVDVNGDGKVDSGDTGLLMQVPATEFQTRSASTANLPLTVAEGAAFNVSLLSADRSRGAHNPAFMRALLIATIQAVQSQYNLAPPAAVQMRMQREGAQLGVRIAAR